MQIPLRAILNGMGKALESCATVDGAITPAGRELQAKILERAETGDSQTAIAKRLGIDRGTILMLRRLDPAFRDQLERVQTDAAALVVEEILEVPNRESDPAMARVRLDALTRYLELRFPRVYGKRIDITVTTVDIGQALAAARARRAQAIDGAGLYTVLDTDTESVPSDIFS